jgi:hypothetical protein
MPDPDRRPSLAATIALLVIGLLILIPSGLCTGFFALAAIVQAIQYPGRIIDSGFLSLILAIGGPLVLLGGFMVWRGVKRLRS